MSFGGVLGFAHDFRRALVRNCRAQVYVRVGQMSS